MVSLGRLSRPFFLLPPRSHTPCGFRGDKPRSPPGCLVLADAAPRLKRYARLACRCAAAPLSALRACGRSGGPRPLRRVAAAPGGSPRRSGLLAAPPSLRSVARVAPADPARPPRGSVPACAPAGGGCAPGCGRVLGGRSAPPRFVRRLRPPGCSAPAGAGCSARCGGREKVGFRFPSPLKNPLTLKRPKGKGVRALPFGNPHPGIGDYQIAPLPRSGKGRWRPMTAIGEKGSTSKNRLSLFENTLRGGIFSPFCPILPQKFVIPAEM